MGKKEICSACNSSEPPSKTKKRKTKLVNWLDCDSCSRWFHSACMRIIDAQMETIASYEFFCDSCTIRGSLIPKLQIQPPPHKEEIDRLSKIIQDLSSELSKLQAELNSSRATCKRQLDRIQSKLSSEDRWEAARDRLSGNINEKLEAIDKGATLAKTCSRTVNSCRLAMNKIPYHEGEDVRDLVRNVLRLLDCDSEMSNVVNCFRLPVKASKWTDRSLTPTIMVIFSSAESRGVVLRKYFERHQTAKLCNLRGGPSLDYRFTLNEVMSINSFRIRNLALRLKQRKLVKSVFVRNDKVSVLLPGHRQYTMIDTLEKLLELEGGDPDSEDTSIFFDATSADLSASSRC